MISRRRNHGGVRHCANVPNIALQQAPSRSIAVQEDELYQYSRILRKGWQDIAREEGNTITP